MILYRLLPSKGLLLLLLHKAAILTRIVDICTPRAIPCIWRHILLVKGGSIASLLLKIRGKGTLVLALDMIYVICKVDFWVLCKVLLEPLAL